MVFGRITLAGMVDRLKSLPLTIFLTVLIWMYAESQVHSVTQESTEVAGVPVLVCAAPAVINRYQVSVEPSQVAVTVSGPAPLIARIRGTSANEAGVQAQLDITAEDVGGPVAGQRRLRFLLPEGLSIASGEAYATYHLRERPGAPAGGAGGTATAAATSRTTGK